MKKLLIIILLFSISLEARAETNIAVDGFSLNMIYPNNQNNVKIHDKVKINVNGSNYIALNYSEAYPTDDRMHFLNIALFKARPDKNIKLIDKMVFDAGRAGELEPPIFFKPNNDYFIFFRRCGGNAHHCEFQIYRIGSSVNEIQMEDDYANTKIKTLLRNDENLTCGSPQYSFKKDMVYAEVAVYQKDDPCCCPTRGKISFVYKFKKNV